MLSFSRLCITTQMAECYWSEENFPSFIGHNQRYTYQGQREELWSGHNMSHGQNLSSTSGEPQISTYLTPAALQRLTMEMKASLPPDRDSSFQDTGWYLHNTQAQISQSFTALHTCLFMLIVRVKSGQKRIRNGGFFRSTIFNVYLFSVYGNIKTAHGTKVQTLLVKSPST